MKTVGFINVKFYLGVTPLAVAMQPRLGLKPKQMV